MGFVKNCLPSSKLTLNFVPLDNLNYAALFLTLNTNPLIGIFGVELGGGGCLVWKKRREKSNLSPLEWMFFSTLFLNHFNL